MRYAKGHKDNTRQHIIEVAARHFREHGVASAGIAGLMADAGLTNGAFYAHFKSKEDLVRATLLDVIDKRIEMLEGALAQGMDGATLVREYLSQQHRDNAGVGCMAAALTAEISRHPAETRDAFTERHEHMIELMSKLVKSGSPKARRQTAMALFGLMIGTMQLSRAVSDEKLSQEILEAGIKGAMGLIAGGEDGKR